MRKTVTLQPGESKVVSFSFTPREARTYHVSVNGLTGSFIASEAPEFPALISVSLPSVAAGAEFYPEFTIFLPKPLHYPAGWWGEELLEAGTIIDPVYVVSFQSVEEYYDPWMGMWPYFYISFRLDPDRLTNPDGIYKLRGRNEEGEPAIAPHEPGLYHITGKIVAHTGWWDGKGWGTTYPWLPFNLGAVGELEVR